MTYEPRTQPTVNRKWGSEKDTMKDMTAAATPAIEEVKAMLADLSGPQKAAIRETLQRIYDMKSKVGHKRVMTLVIPTILIHFTDPDNQ